MNKKEKRRLTGLANYQKRVEKVGIENIKKIGRESALKRKFNNGGFKKENYAARFGRKGGQNSRRSRVITLESELREDEWVILRSYINTVLGNYRLDDKIHAVDQHMIRSIDLQNLQEKGDWVSVMNGFYRLSLGGYIEGRIKYFQVLGEKITDQEKNEYRILRNLRTAWKVAGKVYNVETGEGNTRLTEMGGD